MKIRNILIKLFGDRFREKKGGLVYIPIGIPASGKSTEFEKTVLPYTVAMNKGSASKVVRVSRDLVREMLYPNHNDHYFQMEDLWKNEIMISKHIDNLLHLLSWNGKNVYLDATNLNMKYLRKDLEKLKKLNYSPIFMVMKDSFDLDLCIERDSKRNRVVGPEIIKDMQKKFLGMFKMQKDGTVIPTAEMQKLVKKYGIFIHVFGVNL